MRRVRKKRLLFFALDTGAVAYIIIILTVPNVYPFIATPLPAPTLHTISETLQWQNNNSTFPITPSYSAKYRFISVNVELSFYSISSTISEGDNVSISASGSMSYQLMFENVSFIAVSVQGAIFYPSQNNGALNQGSFGLILDPSITTTPQNASSIPNHVNLVGQSAKIVWRGTGNYYPTLTGINNMGTSMFTWTLGAPIYIQPSNVVTNQLATDKSNSIGQILTEKEIGISLIIAGIGLVEWVYRKVWPLEKSLFLPD